MCACMCVHVCVRICVRACMCIITCVCMQFACMCACVCVSASCVVNPCTHMSSHTACVHTHTHARTHTHTHCKCAQSPPLPQFQKVPFYWSLFIFIGYFTYSDGNLSYSMVDFHVLTNTHKTTTHILCSTATIAQNKTPLRNTHKIPLPPHKPNALNLKL